MNKIIIFFFLILSSFNASAHFLETIGYEFEDYLQYSPAQAIRNFFQINDDFQVGADAHFTYFDMEIRSNPIPLSRFQENEEKISQLFRPIIDIYRTGELREQGFFLPLCEMRSNQSITNIEKLLFEHKKMILFKKYGSKTEDIGPQVTFSLDLRKVHSFFNEQNIPFSNLHMRNNFSMIRYALNKSEKEINNTIDSSKKDSQEVVKGFLATYAHLFGDIFQEIHSNPGNNTIWKFHHPLLLRGGLPHYFELIRPYIKNEPQFKEEVIKYLNNFFIARFRNILPMEKLEGKEFIKETIDYLFDQYAKKEFSSQVYPDKNFTILNKNEAETMAVIKQPENFPSNHQYVYFEVRNFRSLNAEKLSKIANGTPSTYEYYQNYAPSIEEAVSFSKNVTSYLKDFHQRMLEKGIR